MMKIYIEKHSANPSHNYRNYALTSYEREFEERDYPKRSDHTFAYALPKDISNLTSSQNVFLYFMYFGSRARIPSHLANIDWAKVEALESMQKAQKAQEAELETTQSQTIDKTASLNEKIKARKSSIESLQAQIKESQDKIKELESIKKPSDEQKAELQSTRQNLAELESKLDTAQKSLANLLEQLERLANLYDITTGQGLCVDLINYYPTQNLLQEKTQNLAYEIPLRQKELDSMQKELEKTQDEDKKASLQESIQNASAIITQKQAELESNNAELAELEPKVESNLQAYKQAKNDLEYLEKNPLKIIETPEKSE